MKISVPTVWVQCSECQNKWDMTYGDYYYGGFIVRECPKCNYLDTRNSLEPQKPRNDKHGIFITEID